MSQSAAAPTLAYRADIDGLRAVAVLSVVFYHLGFAWLPGGFVGVDLFFVISGYLISRIIYDQSAAGSFSLSAFYVRRARRILPALCAVLLVSAALAGKLLYPAELLAFAQSALAALLFVANSYFHATQDYFAPAADQLPLLHLWSLGVEEQFYLVFPLLILGVRRYAPQHQSTAVLAVLLGSLAFSIWNVASNPQTAFYALHCRAFELLIGSLLALPAMPWPREPRAANALALAGLTCILASFSLFNAGTPFPGMAALLPCVGAALWISAGTNCQAALPRLLGAAPLAAIGKISYSLYLVHWPVIVFGKRLLPQLERDSFALLALGASLLLAMLSYRMIEQPWRHARPSASARSVLASAAGVITLLGAAALVVIANAGFPTSVNVQTARVLAYQQYDHKAAFRSGTCFLDPDQDPAAMDLRPCLPQGRGSKVILWGDSHAAHLYVGLEEALRAKGHALGSLTASLCAPIIGLEVAARPHCRAFNERALSLILAQRPTMVILSAYWPQRDSAMQALDDTVAKLRAAQIKVVILGDTPVFKQSVPKIIADRLQGGAGNMHASAELDLAYLAASERMLAARFAARDGVRYVPVFSTVCPAQRCALLTPDEIPVMFDSAHLTAAGSRWYARDLTPLLLR